MKIIKENKESRRILAQKLDQIYDQENICDDPALSEVDRLMEEAEANLDRQKAQQRKQWARRAAAIVAILTIASSSYLIGMHSNVSASADPDDERKVVQQGDNIVIGTGVSEKDENVGIRVYRFNSLEDVPQTVLQSIKNIDTNFLTFNRLLLKEGKNISTLEAHYYVEEDTNYVIVVSITRSAELTNLIASIESNRYFIYSGQKVYLKEYNDLIEYSIITDENVMSVSGVREAAPIKIEAILEDLLS